MFFQTTQNQDKTGILLINYGAPDSPAGILSYLKNIFSDRDLFVLPFFLKPFRQFVTSSIAKKREPTTKYIYDSIGGKSPLIDITKRQCKGLSEQLSKMGDYFCEIGMRYSSPTIGDGIKSLKKNGCCNFVILPLYPQFSLTTTESAIHESMLQAISLNIPLNNLIFVRSFFKEPSYLDAVAESINNYKVEHEIKDDEIILFSAHSLPVSMEKKGDPYRKEIEETVSYLKKRLPKSHSTKLCYQSQVPFGKWLGPNVLESLHEIKHEGGKGVIVYPVSFVSDQSETLYELDILYKNKAEEMGLKFHRVPCLNDSPKWITVLAKIVHSSLSNKKRIEISPLPHVYP